MNCSNMEIIMRKPAASGDQIHLSGGAGPGIDHIIRSALRLTEVNNVCGTSALFRAK